MSAAPAINNTPAPVESSNVATNVLKQVMKLQDSRTLILPADYSPENALRAAWFHIQNSDNKDKILACTKESQINALYDMVIQGCDVSKKQGYLIPYGNRLTWQRSYFGDAHVAKRVRPGIEIYFDVVYEGEPIRVVKEATGYGYVSHVIHEPAFPRKSKTIVGAYCGVIDENGENMGVEIMDIDQIKTSWKKSKTYGEKSATFHNEQPDQACLRTVIRRRCKPIINSSNDSALLESVRRQEMDSADSEMDEEIAAHGNGQVISVASPPAIEQRSSAQEPAPITLDETTLRTALKINGDQWDYIVDQLADKGEVGIEEFLNTCVREGCKGYKEVAAKLELIPSKTSENKTAENLPF